MPNQPSLKEAILGDKNVLNEITDEFVDEFIGIIHDVYHTKMTATDKKAVLLIHLFQKTLSERTANGSCRMEIARPKGTVVSIFGMQKR